MFFGFNNYSVIRGSTKASLLLSLLFLETLPFDSWLVLVVSHVDVYPSCHPPAAQPAEVSGPWSHAGGLPRRTSSEPGGYMLAAETL